MVSKNAKLYEVVWDISNDELSKGGRQDILRFSSFSGLLSNTPIMKWIEDKEAEVAKWKKYLLDHTTLGLGFFRMTLYERSPSTVAYSCHGKRGGDEV